MLSLTPKHIRLYNKYKDKCDSFSEVFDINCRDQEEFNIAKELYYEMVNFLKYYGVEVDTGDLTYERTQQNTHPNGTLWLSDKHRYLYNKYKDKNREFKLAYELDPSHPDFAGPLKEYYFEMINYLRDHGIEIDIEDLNY